MSQKHELAGKVALVTGGSRGIGRAVALELGNLGAAVMLTYHTSTKLAEKVVGAIEAQGGQASSVQMSLSSRSSIQNAVAKTTEAFGSPTILVNNAAIAQEKPFLDITDEDWDEVLACNLKGAFGACQEVMPAMLTAGFGRIINITSIGGQWGGFNQVHYAASKAGLISLTRSLAKIYSHQGVTCNAVAPGLVETEMTARELDSDHGKEKVSNIPMGRIGTVNEVADVVAFLASEKASYVTGQTINVNGGMLFG